MQTRSPSSPRLLLLAPPGPDREALASLLALQGHVVDLADSLEAAEPLLGHAPKLALVELDREGLDGLATGRGLRRLAPELPLLALVPTSDRTSRVRCLNAGFDDLVARPADPLELRVRVRALIQAAAAAAHERAVLIARDRQLGLGTLSGSVAHDLSNATVRLRQQLDELFDEVSVPLPRQAELHRAQRSIVEAARRLSSLARLSRAEPAEPLHLGDTLRASLRQLVELGPLRNVELVLRVADDAWVWAERAQLEQLVGNLATEALEAISDIPAGERAISLQLELRGGTVALRAEPLRPAGSVRNLARPKSSPRPLGLGPAAVQALAVACGGRTCLEPTFSGRHALTVILPRCAAPADEVAEDESRVA